MRGWSCASTPSPQPIGTDFFGVLAASESLHSALGKVLPRPIPWNIGRQEGSLPSDEHGSSLLPGGGGGLGFVARIAIIALAGAVLLFAIRHAYRR
jgi:hypothetical protein